VQASAQLPDTQKGAVAEVHWLLDVHVVPDGVGSHTESVQVKPVAHGSAALQVATHWPFAQTSPSAHWLERVHTVEVASQAPATHVWPVAQSLASVHAQGPFVPPQTGAVNPSDVSTAASEDASELVWPSSFESAFASPPSPPSPPPSVLVPLSGLASVFPSPLSSLETTPPVLAVQP